MSLSISAQNESTISSLKHQLAEAYTDSAKMFFNNELAWEYRNHDLDSSNYFAHQALSFTQHPSYSLQSTVSFNVLGIAFKRKLELDSAYHYFIKSYKLRLALGDRLRAINCLLNIANTYSEEGKLDSAISYSEQGLKLCNSKEWSTKKVMAKLLNAQAGYYLKFGYYDLAFTKAKSALKIREELELPIEIAQSKLNLGSIYKDQGLYSEAYRSFQEALLIFKSNGRNLIMEAKLIKNLSELDILNQKFLLAENRLNKSISIYKKVNYPSELAGAYINLGHLKQRLGSMDSAQFYFQKAYKIYQYQNENNSVAKAATHLARLWFAENRLDSAFYYLNKAEKLVSEKNVPLKIAIYESLSRIHALQGSFVQAYNYEERASILNQNLFKEKQKASQELLKERSLRKLAQKENQLHEAQLARKKSHAQAQILAIILLTSFLISLIVVLQIRQRKHRLEIEKTKLSERLKQQEAEKLDEIVEVQREQRVKIAQDLHDRLGSLLGVLKIHFENYSKEIINLSSQIKNLKSKRENTLFEVDQLIDEVSSVVQEISQDLRAGTLDKLGLIPAVKELCYRFENTGKIKVELHTESIDENIPSDFKWLIYRNLEESLSNILKHAEAKSVIVQIFKYEDTLSLSVEDDGIGFSVQHALADDKNGMGLSGMKYRSEKYGASFNIDSKVGRGTIIINEFKLKPTQ